MITWLKSKNKDSFFLPVLVLLLVVAAFFIGRLSAQVSTLKEGGTAGEKTAVSPTPSSESKISVSNLKLMAK